MHTAMYKQDKGYTWLVLLVSVSPQQSIGTSPSLSHLLIKTARQKFLPILYPLHISCTGFVSDSSTRWFKFFFLYFLVGWFFLFGRRRLLGGWYFLFVFAFVGGCLFFFFLLINDLDQRSDSYGLLEKSGSPSIFMSSFC